MADADNALRVRLVTPDRVLVDSTADAVEFPATSGYIEALYGHAPLLAELAAGHVRLHGGAEGDQEFFVGAWGFVEVLPDRVTILASSVMKAQEIDAEEANRELEEGKKLWSEAADDADRYARANHLIREAEIKLEERNAAS